MSTVTAQPLLLALAVLKMASGLVPGAPQFRPGYTLYLHALLGGGKYYGQVLPEPHPLGKVPQGPERDGLLLHHATTLLR
jgi:hypothetical protein